MRNTLSALTGLVVGGLGMLGALYLREKKYYEQEEAEEEEELSLPQQLALRSPFAIGEHVLVGNPYIHEFQFYIDEDRVKPKVFTIERAVYDADEDLFRYKLNGLPGYYSQGWLAPNVYGTEVREYPQLEEAEEPKEVDERATSTADSMRVAFAIEDMQIDRALDILNSDASETDKEFARKYLRGESD